jgi:hypothetical protein
MKEGGIKMKKAGQRLFLTVVFLGVMALLIPTYSAAFETIKLGEETEVTFYGWLRNNTGMFLQNPQPFSQSGNDLATERTWLRGYTDFKITNQLRFWSAIQFAYEPQYKIEHGALTSRLLYGGPTLKDGKEYSEYKDPDDILREVYLRWDPSKEHSIKIGRQIAIWGEALTTRVGDVIHPEDQRYSLAFANLEDTRIPSWMVRGTHSIPSIDSTFEWIVNPNIVQDKYRVNRLASIADNTVDGEPGQRFGLYPETRFRAPYSVTNPLLGPPFSIPGVVVANPFSRDWIQAFPGFWVPTAIPTVNFKYPGAWNGTRGGFRTNTTLSGWNFGFTYFHTQEYNPVVKRGDLTGGVDATTGLPLRQYTITYPNKDIIGAYLNKQLPWPGVLRAEAIYVPNQPFNTFKNAGVFPDPITPLSDTIVRRDYIKYMIAYDLNSFLYFQWHKTAPFDITFEHVGEVIPNNKDIQYIIYATEQKQWNPAFNMRISTNWLYNLISTELVVGYMPWGRSGLIMPAVKYMPPWLNKKLSFELKYINIFGKNDFQGLGILRKKDMVLLTSQFDW